MALAARANGAVTTYGYDALDRVNSITHKKAGGAVITAESYVYDRGGNLTSKTVDGVSTTYTYDAIDQLLSETAGGQTVSYTYDANGNRLTKTVGGQTETYSYDDGDKLLSRSGGAYGTFTYGYDACGRTRSVATSGGTTTLIYDYEDRLTSLAVPGGGTTTYAYNGADARVGKAGAGGSRTYRRDGVGVTDPVLSDGASTMVPGISERASGATKFEHLDRLGTASRKTDASGTVAATRTYDAFGLPTQVTDPASGHGYASAFGYQEDAESGLKLLGHRLYDAGTGRFITRDPIGSGTNWYRYADNNPLSGIDPDGLKLRTLTDKEDATRGYSTAEQAEIEAWKKEMRKTKRGAAILQELENDPIDHVIKKGLDGDTDPDPHADASRKDVYLRIDKKYAIETSDGPVSWVRMSNTRILSHELGHLLHDPSSTSNGHYNDDGPAMMNNINANENPVAKELGQPRRASYLWAIYDPASGFYIDPFTKKRHRL